MKNIIVTGGAGFIGTNLIEGILQRKDISKIYVVDNYSTGDRKSVV